jgi:hypothetical protein
VEDPSTRLVDSKSEFARVEFDQKRPNDLETSSEEQRVRLEESWQQKKREDFLIWRKRTRGHRTDDDLQEKILLRVEDFLPSDSRVFGKVVQIQEGKGLKRRSFQGDGVSKNKQSHRNYLNVRIFGIGKALQQEMIKTKDLTKNK